MLDAWIEPSPCWCKECQEYQNETDEQLKEIDWEEINAERNVFVDFDEQLDRAMDAIERRAPQYA